MQLSSEEFFLFQHNGYLRVSQAVSPDLNARLKEVIQRHAEQRIEPLVSEHPEMPGRGVSGDFPGARVLRLSRVLGRDPVFHKVARAPQLMNVLQALLGPNVEVVLNRHNHVTLRPPGAASLEWHRDVTNWSRTILSAIFYLEDSTIENGCTWVLPGSHQMLAFHAGVSGHGRMETIGPLQHQAVPVPAKAGDVLICNGVLLHGSGANQSSSSRMTMTLGYHAVDELGLKEEPHKELVSGERVLQHNTPGTAGPRATDFVGSENRARSETWRTAAPVARPAQVSGKLKLRRSLELYERAERLIPGGSQTSSKQPRKFAFGGYPIYAERARGCRVVDVDGNEYIDLVQAFGPVILGYGYTAADQALQEQLEKGVLYGLMSPLEVECAELICRVVPCAQMVRFFKGGGEATAAVARTVRGFTGREVILNAGYRGWPDVWSALMNDSGVPVGLRDSVAAFKRNDLDDLKQQLLAHKGRVAAIFLDLYSDVPPAGYLEAVKDLCHENGALLVFDEVVTGFRLALGGAQQYFGVTPDLACFAKAVGNGMPLACVAGRVDVMASMADRFISITYGGESLSLAVAIAVIHELRTKNVHEHLWRIGRRLREGLNEASERAGLPFECRGFDPMTVMSFDVPGSKDTPPVRDANANLVWEYVLQEMAVRGVLMSRGGANFVTYAHGDAEIDYVVSAAGEVFSDLRELWQSPRLAAAVRARKHTSLL